MYGKPIKFTAFPYLPKIHLLVFPCIMLQDLAWLIVWEGHHIKAKVSHISDEDSRPGTAMAPLASKISFFRTGAGVFLYSFGPVHVSFFWSAANNVFYSTIGLIWRLYATSFAPPQLYAISFAPPQRSKLTSFTFQLVFFKVGAWVLFAYFVLSYYALLFPMVHGQVNIIITAAHATSAVATLALAIITTRIDPADDNVKVWKIRSFFLPFLIMLPFYHF